jgi:hypothetical protein
MRPNLCHSRAFAIAEGKALGAEVAVLLIRQARGLGAPGFQLLEFPSKRSAGIEVTDHYRKRQGEVK